MGKMEMFRKALALPEVIQNVELTGILKELYTDHLELLETNNELKEKIRELSKTIEQNNKFDEIEKKLIPHSHPYYTLQGDTADRYFCATCWSKSKTLMQLRTKDKYGADIKNLRVIGKLFECPECKTHGEIKE